MRAISTRGAPNAPLTTTAIAAIATGIGIILLCLFALAFLLVKAVRIHKQLLADLEERGLTSAQARGEGDNSVARPRAVLRRHTILPFNTKMGWDTLTSLDTLNSTEPAKTVAHYAPPKPTEDFKRASRLSWPFSAKRMSGHNIHMKKMKGSKLSTVIEEPKPSAMVPVLGSSHLNASGRSLSTARPSSCQSMLQNHPVFRSSTEGENMDNVGPVICVSFFRSEANNRLQRARSVAAVPSAVRPHKQLRARSTSLCSQASGLAPDVILPPLPLDIERIKSEARRCSQLNRIPSKQSVSSYGSADTSILASKMSPILTKTRPQKITKPQTRDSSVRGPRPFRDTLDLRAQVLGSQHTANGITPRTNVTSLEMPASCNEGKKSLSEGSSSQSVGTVTEAQSVTVSKVSSPDASPLAVRKLSTPKRKLKTLVSSEGSPERQHQNVATSRVKNQHARSPKRQHSQTSSRSSGGNPFQWDPTPLSSASKPSALKGSPCARQGHRRKNSVRISLVPTFHGPPSRTPSPSTMLESKGDTMTGADTLVPVTGLGLGFSGTRSLPTPPSSSTFAPDLKFSTTSLRASLTSTSPELPLVNYDQGHVVFPTDHILPQLSLTERKRLSDGSIFSLSRFPATPSVVEPSGLDMSYSMTYTPAEPYNYGDHFGMPETPYIPQHPFRPCTPEQNRSPSQDSLIDIDEYDPELPSLVFQTPSNVPSRAWQSGFAAIPEESSVASQKTLDVDSSRYNDSPPVSSKTMSPPRFVIEDRSAYNLPIYATAIPEEYTIDPAILSKDAFTVLNSSVSNVNTSLFRTSNSNRSSAAIAIPSNMAAAQNMFDPLLAAASPAASTQTANMAESPVLGHLQSEASSTYSSPSPSPNLSPTSSPIQLPSPVMPCSPRPSHAELPNNSLTINFADVPKLAPSPRGPRGSPPRPLRSSIAALRRMNSDAADAKRQKSGRGERRYLRLGREDGVQLPNDESWLDNIEDDVTVELDEAEGRRLVGDVLDDWEEGCTMLDLNEDTSLHSESTIRPGKQGSGASTPVREGNDTTSGASPEDKHSSNIWEDGEKFWASTPPPSSALNNTATRYQPIASSPLASPYLSVSTTPLKVSKKGDFQVAKDTVSPTENSARDSDRKKRRESQVESKRTSRYRKRSVLGTRTPNVNVRIQVTSPSGHVTVGTPVSLYDAQGFLSF